jgi:hypothetical protein
MATAREQRPRVMFVGGYGRSGSTVLDGLLDRVPGITAVGEFRHLFGRALHDNELCSCGTPFNDCAYWSTVLDKAFPQGFDRARIHEAVRTVNRVVAAPPVRYPSLRTRAMREHCRIYSEAFVAAYRAVAEVSGASVVVDSSKYPLHGLFLSTVPDVDLVAMLFVRDPRAVAYSWTRHKLRTEVHWKEQEMPRHGVTRSALAFNLSNWLTERLRGRGVPLRRQRYEDLVADPLPTLAAIASFALGHDVEVTDSLFHAEIEPSRHTIAGNPVKLETGRIELRADDAWRTAMSRGKQTLVRVLCAPQMRRYGYRGRA